MNDALIEVKHLTFKRGERVIYRDLNLRVPRGKITAIMGPSGIGKTTLLKLIGGQLIPDEGEILFDGQDICKLSNSELYEVRKRMGMLFQSGALFTDISTFDNVAFAIREHTNLPPSLIRQIVLMKLEAVGLRGAADLMPSELSGGMARRAALARAMLKILTRRFAPRNSYFFRRENIELKRRKHSTLFSIQLFSFF